MIDHNITCFNEQHWRAGLHLLRYLVGTKGEKLTFSLQQAKDATRLAVLCDANYAVCPDTRKSFTGFAVLYGNATIAAAAFKQKCIATSSSQAEYH